MADFNKFSCELSKQVKLELRFTPKFKMADFNKFGCELSKQVKFEFCSTMWLRRRIYIVY